MKSNKKKLPTKQITNDDKLNYIRRFICINLKKINLITKIEQFEIEYSDDSDDEFVNINNIENE
jgi:hypothetical protein